jgi:hypothetical protein
MLKRYSLMLAGAAIGLIGSAHAAHVGYSVGGSEGNTLVSFDVGGPAALNTLTITGDTNRLDALAYRPETGELYGYDSGSDAVYLIDTATGATTFVAAGDGNVGTADVAFDFNNNLDAARIIGTNDSNSVFFPNDTPPDLRGGAPNNIFDVFYADSDPNADANPSIVGNGYTFQTPGGDPAQQQFGLDSETDSLVTIANNAGTLETVAAITLDGLPFDVQENGGFDIFFSPDEENIAYALLSSALGNSQNTRFDLYTIDLVTGEASLVQQLAQNFDVLRGLAVFVPNNEIPVPGAAILFGSAIAGFAARRKARKA